MLGAAVLAGTVALIPVGVPAGVGLEVTPAKLDISIPLGLTQNIPITVHNNTTTPVHVQAQMVDFGLTKAGEYEFVKAGTKKNSLMRYAAINPREFDIAPNAFQQVKLSLVLPAAGLAGEYAGIVFFQTRPERHSGNAVSFSTRVASKIYESVPGTTKLAGAITNMVELPTPGGELYRVTFKNIGNQHVYLNGRVEVRRGSETVDKITMPSAMLVERGGERVIDVSGKKLRAGSYQAVAIIDYGAPKQIGGEVRFDAR